MIKNSLLIIVKVCLNKWYFFTFVSLSAYTLTTSSVPDGLENIKDILKTYY